MAMLERLMTPNFDPGATVETVTVRPRSAREDNIKELDEQLMALLHPKSEKDQRQPETAPNVPASPSHG